MKRAIAALAFGFILGFASFAYAGSGNVTRPEPTSAIHIAMLYEKLISDRTPDFADWVMETPKYKKAELYERQGRSRQNLQPSLHERAHRARGKNADLRLQPRGQGLPCEIFQRPDLLPLYLHG
jgi:hypothetical protein